MEFAHPEFLALLAVLPLLWLGQRRSLANMTARQRTLCFAMRVLILLLLIAALAGIAPAVAVAKCRGAFGGRSIREHFARCAKSCTRIRGDGLARAGCR